MSTPARHGQGSIVVGVDPFGAAGSRPYLVLSNRRHPFAGGEYIAALVTTTERPDAIPLADAYVEGRLPFPSFVNPWNVLTIKADAIEKRVAAVAPGVVESTITASNRYLEPDEGIRPD